jgi:hypothetical protein
MKQYVALERHETIQQINTIHMKLNSPTIEHINTVQEVYRFSTLKRQSALQVQLYYKFNTTHRYTRNEPVHQS